MNGAWNRWSRDKDFNVLYIVATQWNVWHWRLCCQVRTSSLCVFCLRSFFCSSLLPRSFSRLKCHKKYSVQNWNSNIYECECINTLRRARTHECSGSFLISLSGARITEDSLWAFLVYTSPQSSTSTSTKTTV